MKKIKSLVLVLCLVLALGLVFSACGPKTPKDDDEDDNPPVTVTPQVSISPATLTLDLGEAKTLAATAIPAGTAVTWVSGNANIASVENGAVTGIAEGTTNITAKITVDGKEYISAACAVKVNGPQWGLFLSKYAFILDVNETTEAVTVTTADAGTIVWTSEDATVATVENGVITAKKNGNTFIVASGAKSFGKVSVSVRGDDYLGVGTWTPISDKAEFLAMNSNAASRYYLTQDIDFGGDKIEPIGGRGTDNAIGATNFGGILEGNGFAVKNFKIEYPEKAATPIAPTVNGEPNPEYELAHNGNSYGTFGLFYQLKAGATIRNLNVVDFSVLGHLFVAGLVGTNAGTIENCYVSGKVTNYQYFGENLYDCPGGLIAGMNNATGKIKNCISYAQENDGRDGFGNNRTFAVAAWNWGEISNCFAVMDNLEMSDALTIAAAVQTGPPPMVPPTTSEMFMTSDGANLSRYNKLLGAAWVFEAGKLPYLNSTVGARAWVSIF